jgi:hypothetical protein
MLFEVFVEAPLAALHGALQLLHTTTGRQQQQAWIERLSDLTMLF